MLSPSFKFIAVASGILMAWLAPYLGSSISHQPPVTDSREAWNTSLKFIDVQLKDWMLRQANRERNEYVRMDLLCVKKFAISDVHWDDGRHVTVHTILGVTPRISFHSNSSLYYLWTNRVELESDGVRHWWKPGVPVFESVSLTSDQCRMPTEPLITIAWEHALIR